MLSLLLTGAAAGTGHLFILSGQSNLERLDPQRFARVVKRRLRPEPVWQIRVAHGGQSIRGWVEGWDELARAAQIPVPDGEAGAYYGEILEAYRNGVVEHGVPETVTLIWAQGETDVRKGLAAVYQPAFEAFVQQLQDDLEAPRLHLVLGRLSDFQPRLDAPSQAWADLRSWQVERGSRRGTAWVDTDDLNDLGERRRSWNDLHYSKRGYRIFAKRLALQAAALVSGRSTARDGRP